VAVVMGFSRIYLFMHYPSDVLTGAILGVIFGIVSWKIVGKRCDKKCDFEA
jgi:undecaprenyl-diphosphatase